jgi:Domain of unknown function (DUF1835)
MTTFHILNGDCLAEQLSQTSINQDFIVCRECLIDGNITANYLTDFWKIRANFITETYGASIEDYFSKSVNELEKLNHLPDNSELCLWFENDLFCQTNMWFVLSLLSIHTNLQLYRIFPIIENKADIWKGFGIADTKSLELAYSKKVPFKPMDIELGLNLWIAYQNRDFEKLKELSKENSVCFEYLEEVCQAHIDRFPLGKTLGRPDQVVKQIMDTKSKEFSVVFEEFSAQEGIYGFGDLQVKSIYDRVIASN